MMRGNGMNSSVDTLRELNKKRDAVNTIIEKAREQHSVTLLYATKEEKFNNAVALKEFLEEKIRK
jgi:uncharacterized protein YeaO (DUF488 family)